MSDFASQIGGSGTDTDFSAVPAPESWAYFWNGDTLNLNMGGEDDLLDARGQTGDATVYGGDGDDDVTTTYTETNFLSGQDGNDSINGSADSVTSAPNAPDAIVDNTIAGANSTLLGGNGNDSLVGTGGDNKLDGGIGNDTFLAGSGNDSATGGDGTDSIAGEAGSDQLFGGSGDDTVWGGSEDDFLVGGSGSDLLGGDSGNDWLYGGSGSDTFVFDDGFGQDIIADFDVTADQITLTSDINGSGITSASDLLAPGFLSGGTDPNTGEIFTTITIGGDTITVYGVDQVDFAANISTYVKIV